MKSVVRDIDLGWDKFKREIKQAGKASAKIGVLQGAKAYPEGTSQAEVAFYNEFGTSKIPARPFLRPTADSNRKKYTVGLAKVLKNLPRDATIKQALEKVAMIAQADVRATITKLRTPPNAPSTIAQKGSSNPLIDTGAMRRSIDYEVKG